ncbi:MAG: hypothetical protein A3K19_00940 [Lentisphaerae bacterium RIFOXYB12_FULL_65_16]|nr:MAG: hypothetical protein A3K18_18985 [Lentisphaerae bacterium RIFOXYA12_64_32]OGV85571.1 MAG: hypothetical protein A3K19_00940 [Lentisphaerae bacterium RIFOXYB12_FULL_65_16]
MGLACVAVGILIGLTVFTLHLGTASYDSFVYKGMAKANAGIEVCLPPEETQRPPLLPLLLTPMASLRHLGVSNERISTLMHLFSLGLASCLVMVTYRLLRQFVSSEVSALGALLLLIHPGMLVYSFETMTDVPVALFAAAAVLCQLRSRGRDRWRDVIGICALLGSGIAMKYSMVIMPALMSLAELVAWRTAPGHTWRRAVRWKLVWTLVPGSLACYLLVGFISFAPIYGFSLESLRRSVSPFACRVADFAVRGRDGATQAPPSPVAPHANPAANLSFLAYHMTPVGFALMLAGIFLATGSIRTDPRLILLVAWWAGFLAAMTFLNRHWEYRYLLPLVPASYALAMIAVQRGLDAVSHRCPANSACFPLQMAILAGVASWPTAAMVREVAFLNESRFSAPFSREVVAEVRSRLREDRRIFWFGFLYAVYSDTRDFPAGDPFYKMYHVGPDSIGFFVDRAIPAVPARSRMDMDSAFRDGDLFVVSTLPFPVSNDLCPPAADLPPLVVGSAECHSFVSVSAQRQRRTLCSADGRTQCILGQAGPVASVSFQGGDVLTPWFLVCFRLDPAGGDTAGSPETVVSVFQKGVTVGMRNQDPGFVDRVRAVTIVALHGRELWNLGQRGRDAVMQASRGCVNSVDTDGL